jgi:CRP-like cAMP-binding protein
MRQLFYVPDEAEALSASLMELLRAVAPGITAARAAELANAVSLDHIVSLPHGVEEQLGPGGSELTVSERQRLMLAVAIAAEPRVLLVGSLLALADVDSALPLIDVLRNGSQESTVISVRSGEVAEAVDVILFVSGGSARVGTHQQLLVDVPEYSHLWEQRLATADVDLSVIGIDEADTDRMLARLVTEHYSPGDLIYRQGSPADRILFIISGHVEITTSTAHGGTQRVAVLGPGNHCGDLRLTAGEVRAENALALDDCVVRSLSRQAITAGLTGLLDRSAVERRIIESLLRVGPATRAELRDRLPDVDGTAFASSISLLTQDGAIRDDDGVVSAVLQRSAKTGTRDLLDRLGDL